MNKLIPRLIGFWLNNLVLIFPNIAGKQAFNIFRTPMAPPVTDYHQRFFNTSLRSAFEHNGIKIQTYRWGNGPKTILFLHGWQSHSFRWKKYIETFSAEEHTFYALDAPAHGLSGGKYIHLPLYTEVVEKFIAQIKPIDTVVTHSFGGFAILYAFHRNPDLPVSSLVMTGVPGEASDFFITYKNAFGLKPRILSETRKFWKANVGYEPEYFSAARFAAELKIPGLIVHDEGDEETPYAYAVKIHGAWKNSELMTTKGLGHNLKSVDVVHRIQEFITKKKPVRNAVN